MEWLKKENNYKIVVDTSLIILATTIIGLYTAFESGYDINKLISWKTLIDTVFINVTLILVKYSIMDLTLVNCRAKEDYKTKIIKLSESKTKIEDNKLLKLFAEYLDELNIERKKRAYLSKLDNQIKLLENKNKHNVDINKLRQEKIDFIDGNKELNKLNIDYNMVVFTDIFSGTNIANDNDLSIGFNTSKEFAKKNIKSTLITFIIVTLTGGMVFNYVSSGQLSKLLIFALMIVTAMFMTYYTVNHLEEYEYNPRLDNRNKLVKEFLDKNYNAPSKEPTELESKLK